MNNAHMIIHDLGLRDTVTCISGYSVFLANRLSAGTNKVLKYNRQGKCSEKDSLAIVLTWIEVQQANSGIGTVLHTGGTVG